MHHDEKEQLNPTPGKVTPLRESPSQPSYSLDEILAEYGAGTRQKNVVSFPGAAPPPPQEEVDAPTQSEEETSAPGDDSPSQEGRVVEFPEEESVLSSFLKDITKKADAYADQMFEESENMDVEEVRRLEELIPGTDWEEEDPSPNPHRVRPPRKPEPPPPDLSPQELARVYGKGLGALRVRSLVLFLLAGLALAQLLLPTAGLSFPAPLDQPELQLWICVGLLGLGMLLSLDLLATGLGRAIRGRFGMDTLAAGAACLTLADALVLALGNPSSRNGQLPYTAVVLTALFFQLRGQYHKRCGLRLACRTAAGAAQPDLVTQDEALWNGRDAFRKWAGPPIGFGSQIQMDDGAQRIFRRVCPLLALACVLFSLLASYGVGNPQHLLWCLSATFSASAAFGGTLLYGRPFHRLTRRLAQTGATLAGWPGVAQSRSGTRILITDGDLFPCGYVELNGIKVFGDHSVEKVISCTATLIRDSGSGLTRLFHDLMRTQGGLFRRTEHLTFHEGGGISALIRGEEVLVGSSAFMTLMKVDLPQGLHVKNAVFCAFNGALVGIFALNYTLPDTVFPALESLIGERVGPILATRDFNLIPAMLHQRFRLAADKMDFPPIQRRRELSDPDQPHNPVLTAVLCREGLLPYAESVVSARRLRRATLFGSWLVCIGSTLGILLAYYLTSVSAYSSLSSLNLFLFSLSWLLPVWFLTGWVPRF